jgi:NADH:ubiquinone oxidoreductase subunit C
MMSISDQNIEQAKIPETTKEAGKEPESSKLENLMEKTEQVVEEAKKEGIIEPKQDDAQKAKDMEAKIAEAKAKAAAKAAAAQGPAIEVENVEDIEISQLLEKTQQKADKKIRFVTTTCLDKGDKLEVYYHFDDNYKMEHLRIKAGPEDTVPSISGIYLCAFLVENEMQELFGLKISGIAIDYQGKMLLCDESLKFPMLKSTKC